MISVQINVERDSVCMGDDIDAPHSYSFTLNSKATLQDIFIKLAKDNYLANVAGNNHSWVAKISREEIAVIEGNSKLPKPNSSLDNKLYGYGQSGQINVYFTYKSATT
ncbi:hypothetical protein ACKC5O_10970 [Aeromonas schubertii]|uniref:Uncharacterized protein n=1 Tax=Aeromonas schubertii TaxID=652 RepID=A0ABS7VG83_9GAMM|nr:hypothetical protein [Aeromonas schubertii]MBZ6067968.1 hypothetical protein [Aeromonas schubertii]